MYIEVHTQLHSATLVTAKFGGAHNILFFIFLKEINVLGLWEPSQSICRTTRNAAAFLLLATAQFPDPRYLLVVQIMKQ